MRPIITLTTDFGTQDSYVGVMKGVILSICPDAQIIDITHAIPPQNVTAAALVVPTVVPYFPPTTVHVVVVDPGVGSARRAIALATPQGRFVGPDNGIFAPIWQETGERSPTAARQAVALTEPRFWLPQVSATFHGRDIFAPVAAHLAAGVPLAELGDAVDDIVAAPIAAPQRTAAGSLNGAIVSIDHFGNCISNITAQHLDHHGAEQTGCMRVDTTVVAVQRTYADVAPGELLALIGSSGYLELAVRNGNASAALGICVGTAVQWLPGEQGQHPG